MHKKALTVAIAGALAAPLAAQAVDFSVSGHVNRALFLTDFDNSTRAQVKDGGSSGTRVRFTGSSEMDGMAGGSIGINLEYSAGQSLGLRHAAVNMKGDFGNISVGQSDQAGNWKGNPSVHDVWGIGIGQDMAGLTGSVLAPYFSSLSNGRTERIRYDTPSIGLASGSVSVGNNDQVGIEANISQSMDVASFSAGVGAQQIGGAQNDFFGARAVIKLSNGLGWSIGYGARQNHAGGTTDPTFMENTLAYSMGDSAIGLSWYAGSDFVNEGSDSTAIGVGAHHKLPKLGVRLYVAAQNYSVEDGTVLDTDGNVFVAGARVQF